MAIGKKAIATPLGKNTKHVELTDAEKIARAAEEAAYTEWQRLNTYKEERRKAYPSIEEQLDKIYHEGLDAWKAEIAAIKAAHPKPTE